MKGSGCHVDEPEVDIWREPTIIQYSHGLLPSQVDAPGDFTVRVSRRLCPAFLLGTLGRDALLEVVRQAEEPVFTTLRTVSRHLLETPEIIKAWHRYRSVSYRYLSNAWLEKLASERVRWSGQPTKDRPVPFPADLLRMRSEWLVTIQREGDAPGGKIVGTSVIRGDCILVGDYSELRGPYESRSSASREAGRLMGN